MGDATTCAVAVVGGGPAGLSAAIELARRGVDDVVVLERDADLGGVPRHCGHPPFGIREFGRVLTGPAYAARLAAAARNAGVAIRPRSTVVSLHPGGRLTVSSPETGYALHAARVILATGVREMSRAARLVSGSRPVGVLTTGALQAMIYLQGLIPFRAPVVIGSELVAFSALYTCLKAGIKPAAMIEENDRVTAWRSLGWLPRLAGVSVRTATKIVAIEGRDRVEGVRVIDRHGTERTIDCDGVVFTGRFVPEASLVRASHLTLDASSGGPEVDQFGRCSDPAYFAVGNLLRPVETAGWCFREGRAAAGWVAEDLAGRLLARTQTISISHGALIRFVLPQQLACPLNGRGMAHLQLRFDHRAAGELSVASQTGTMWRRSMVALPERRVLIPLDRFAGLLPGDSLRVEFRETA